MNSIRDEFKINILVHSGRLGSGGLVYKKVVPATYTGFKNQIITFKVYDIILGYFRVNDNKHSNYNKYFRKL